MDGFLQTDGFSPAPMDLNNVTLSRELQVGFYSFNLTLKKNRRARFDSMHVCPVSAGHGGSGGRKLPQYLGKEEEIWTS